jgi:hypothetical protein
MGLSSTQQFHIGVRVDEAPSVFLLENVLVNLGGGDPSKLAWSFFSSNQEEVFVSFVFCLHLPLQHAVLMRNANKANLSSVGSSYSCAFASGKRYSCLS